MQTCPNCGASMAPTAKFCTKCGTKLAVQEVPVENQQFASSETFENTSVESQNFNESQQEDVAANGFDQQAQYNQQAFDNTDVNNQFDDYQTQAMPEQQDFNQQQNFNQATDYNQNFNQAQDFNNQQNFAQQQYFNNQQNFDQQAYNNQANAYGQPGFNNQFQQPYTKPRNPLADFFNWFVLSLKQPSLIVAGEKWYGFVAFAVSILIYTISLGMLFNTAANSNSNLRSVISATNLDSTTFGLLFKLFLCLAIATMVVVGGTFGITKLTHKDTEDFFTFTNNFAHFTNYTLVINLVLLLVSLVTANSLGFLIFLMILELIIFFNGSFVAYLMDRGNLVKLDRVFGMLLIALLNALVIFLITRIFGEIVVNTIVEFIQQTYSNAISSLLGD